MRLERFMVRSKPSVKADLIGQVSKRLDRSTGCEQRQEQCYQQDSVILGKKVRVHID